MNNSTKILAIVLIELVIVAGLFIKINLDRRNTLGVSINRIDSKFINKAVDSKYKYYYELQPNTIEYPMQRYVDKAKKIKSLTNLDTFADRYNYTTEKFGKTFRVITLGDSFTFGFNVSTSDNWSEKLEVTLVNNEVCNSSEVINLGVYGYDIQYAHERYRLRGQKYDPDLVIWLIKDDDLIELEEYLKELGYKTQDPFTDDMQTYYRIWEESISNLGRENIIATQTEALYSIRDLFKKKLLIVSLTKGKEYTDILKKFVEDTPDSYLLEINLPESMTFEDQHPDEKGHLLIADEIYGYLVKNNLINCE